MPAQPFELDPELFCKNVRSARRGATTGTSGMAVEHLLGLVESDHDLEVFASFARLVSQGCVLRGVLEGFRLGRVTALQKPDGGIRGIIVGDIFRRLIARTIAQQISKQVEEATAPHQYALQTKSGCECVSHMVQMLTQLNPRQTVVSVDGVGAFDLVSRNAMLQGLGNMTGGAQVLPFVRLFCSDPSTYVWEDEFGEPQMIP